MAGRKDDAFGPASFDEPPVALAPHPPRRRGRHRHEAQSAPERTVFWSALTLVSVAVLLLLLLLLASRLTRHSAFLRLSRQDRSAVIAENVSVNGTPVGGFSREQAAALLSARSAPAAEPFEYRIHVGDMVWFMTGTDLVVSGDEDALVEQAWSAGRRLSLGVGETVDSPLAARERLRRRIAAEGLEIAGSQKLEGVGRYVDGLAASIDREPVNAGLRSVDFSTRSFSFTEDSPGLTLDREALVSELTRLLDAGETDADVDAPIRTVAARIGRLRLMNSFGCLEVRSFDTETPAGDREVRAAIGALNGAIIPGGGTISFRALLDGCVSDYAAANGTRFGTALFSAGLCAGMRLEERSGDEAAEDSLRGLEARLDETADLRLTNTADTPLCVLCYYTPHNSRGTRGAVTLEFYGILRQGGESAALSAEVIATAEPGAPEYRVDPELTPGTQLLRREARAGATVQTRLVKTVNGRTYASDIICTTVYPPIPRLIETGP